MWRKSSLKDLKRDNVTIADLDETFRDLADA